jgi:hypothetical protein
MDSQKEGDRRSMRSTFGMETIWLTMRTKVFAKLSKSLPWLRTVLCYAASAWGVTRLMYHSTDSLKPSLIVVAGT